MSASHESSDKLGFAVAFEAGPTYGGVVRDDDLIHLDGAVNGAAGSVTCRVEIAEVEPLYAELEPRGVIDPEEPLRTTPWGTTQFSVRDLDGNRITFTTPSPSDK